jgi:transcriptional regulator with XRE-family HTH domain
VARKQKLTRREAAARRRLGQRIQQARLEAHLIQKELADRIGIKSAQSISNYERGEQEVPPYRLRLIGEATNKPLSWFYGEISAEEARAAEQDARKARDVDIARRLARIEEALGIARDDPDEPPHRRADEG